MKHVMLLILTISLSNQVYAETSVNRAAAPSSDVSITDQPNGQQLYSDYDNSDLIQTGQSATRREYQYEEKVKACRSIEGAWLRAGEIGYSSCMENSQTMKK